MKARVGTFAFESLAEESERDPAVAILPALSHYAQELSDGPGAPDLPRFLIAERAAKLGVEVEIDEDLLAIYSREAGRRSISLGDLLNHAVFVYLAGLDASPSTS